MNLSSTRHSSLVSLSLLRAASSASSHLAVDVRRSIASSDTKQQPYPTGIVCLFFSAGTNTPYLLRCSKLELFNTIQPEQDLGLISSVTSMDFRKVIFSPIVRGFLLNERYWIPFDDNICGLADRLRASENEHTLELEVELQIRIEEFGEEGCQEWFLP